MENALRTTNHRTEMNVSDKVVCVDDSPGRGLGKCLGLGKVYVVEGVDPTPRVCGTVGLYLVGVPNYIAEDGDTIGWQHTRFRLLADLKAEATAAAAQQQQTK